jgi:hypothetical protein
MSNIIELRAKERLGRGRSGAIPAEARLREVALLRDNWELMDDSLRQLQDTCSELRHFLQAATDYPDKEGHMASLTKAEIAIQKTRAECATVKDRLELNASTRR